MSLQKTVNRNYTAAFIGDVVRDGPMRAKSARIASATLGTDPGASTNRISRAFGYSGEMPALGTTSAALEATVIVGGARFFGVLFHPKHYALNGDSSGSLAPSMDVPIGFEGEFADMVTGLAAELINETTASKTVTYGDGVAYFPSTVSTANNPQALPYGALFSVPAGSAAPTGSVLIPNARVINSVTQAASAAGALVSSVTFIQLTQ